MAMKRMVLVVAGALSAALLAANGGCRRPAAPPGVGIPVGTVLAFTGERVPEGWLLCDGRPLRREQWPELYRAIGTSHGRGVSPLGVTEADFNLPDYRGRFLRGVDEGDDGIRLHADLGADTRSPTRAGGNAGNRVGSYQPDATAFPRDPAGGFRVAVPPEAAGVAKVPRAMAARGWVRAADWSVPRSASGAPEDARLARSAVASADTAGSAAPAGAWREYRVTGGDQETRPKNVSVRWIIRAKP
jgi:hypothetical protein